jgi:hypothetical protein
MVMSKQEIKGRMDSIRQLPVKERSKARVALIHEMDLRGVDYG